MNCSWIPHLPSLARIGSASKSFASVEELLSYSGAGALAGWRVRSCVDFQKRVADVREKVPVGAALLFFDRATQPTDNITVETEAGPRCRYGTSEAGEHGRLRERRSTATLGVCSPHVRQCAFNRIPAEHSVPHHNGPVHLGCDSRTCVAGCELSLTYYGLSGLRCLPPPHERMRIYALFMGMGTKQSPYFIIRWLQSQR